MAEVGEPLSAREIAVLKRLADGSTNKEIAQELSISPHTVKVHLRNIFKKLDVSSRTEAITVAMQQGIIAVPGTGEAADLLDDQIAEEAAGSETSDQLPVQDSSDASSTVGTRWQLISIGLLLIVVLLVGVIFGPRITGSDEESGTESLDETGSARVTQPIENSDWHIAPSMPSERTNMALVAVGLELFQIGGEVSAGVVNLVDIYETGSGIWRTAAAKPTAVADTNAAVLFGEIYVPGGKLADGQPTAVVEAYSPANNAWRPVTPMPSPVAGGLVLADNGLLYVLGGWDGEDYLSSVYVYDPGVDEWDRLEPMSQPRSNPTGGLLANDLYVVGGRNSDGELDICEFYRPVNGDWQECPPMLVARSGAGAAVLGNDRLFVFGGGADSDVRFGEMYNLDNDTWSEFEIPMLEESTSWLNLGVTNVETRIYVVGGQQGEEILASNYIYAPFIHQTYLPAVGGD